MVRPVPKESEGEMGATVSPEPPQAACGLPPGVLLLPTPVMQWAQEPDSEGQAPGDGPAWSIVQAPRSPDVDGAGTSPEDKGTVRGP